MANKGHNRPGGNFERLNAKQAKARHRKHGHTVEFDSDCLLEGKAFKKGGVQLTFTDGSDYFYPDLDKDDLKDLAASNSAGTTFNKEIR